MNKKNVTQIFHVAARPPLNELEQKKANKKSQERFRFCFRLRCFHFQIVFTFCPCPLPTNTNKYTYFIVLCNLICCDRCVQCAQCTVFRALAIYYLVFFFHCSYPAAESWRRLPTIIMTEVKNLRCFLLAHTTVWPMACLCVCMIVVAKAFCEQ